MITCDNIKSHNRKITEKDYLFHHDRFKVLTMGKIPIMLHRFGEQCFYWHVTCSFPWCDIILWGVIVVSQQIKISGLNVKNQIEYVSFRSNEVSKLTVYHHQGFFTNWSYSGDYAQLCDNSLAIVYFKSRCWIDYAIENGWSIIIK